jgi:hypothetical protein
MANKKVPSKEYHELIAKEEERKALALSIEVQTKELMACGFTYQQAMSWINKQRISNIFDKDERKEEWD